MRDKLKLTEQLVAQLPDPYKVSLEQARLGWWFNISNRGGLRLTALGFKVFTEHLNFEYFPYKITDEMTFTQRTVLDLDRRLKGPYYIVTKKGFPMDVIFFSSKEAMLVNLYGSLDKFLDNYR